MNLQQAMLQMMQSNLNKNPLYQRAQQMAQGKNEEQLKQTAENLCKNMGIDINKAYEEFQKMQQSGMR